MKTIITLLLVVMFSFGADTLYVRTVPNAYEQYVTDQYWFEIQTDQLAHQLVKEKPKVAWGIIIGTTVLALILCVTLPPSADVK